MQNHKSGEHDEHTWFVVRLRIGPVTASLKKLTNLELKDNSQLILQSKCALPDWHSRNKKLLPLKHCTHRRHMLPHQRVHTNGLDQLLESIKHKLEPFIMPILSCANTYQETINLQLSTDCIHFHLHLQGSTIDPSQYWPFTHVYSIWNATVAALQFWMADLKPHILSNVKEGVHAAFFYGDYTQQMQSLLEETLFSHFVTTKIILLQPSLHRRMKIMRVGVKVSTSTPFSAENQECTMFQPWRNCPSIPHTLVNHQLHQSTMKGTQPKDADVTALHTAN